MPRVIGCKKRESKHTDEAQENRAGYKYGSFVHKTDSEDTSALDQREYFECE